MDSLGLGRSLGSCCHLQREERRQIRWSVCGGSLPWSVLYLGDYRQESCVDVMCILMHVLQWAEKQSIHFLEMSMF